MLFFPFSFMKKTVGHFAKYLTEDYSRAVILHDMMKSYEMADEKYDLGKRYEAYLPILGKMRRSNLFAYGLSPGEFGGPNAPFLRAIWHSLPGQAAEAGVAGMARMAGRSEEFTGAMMNSPVMSALMPNAVSIKDADDMNTIQYNVKRMFPLWADFGHLVGDIMEQAEVIVSPHHMTKRAQNEEAWEAWNSARDDVRKILHGMSLPFSAVDRSSPYFVRLREYLDSEKARLLAEYPSWGADMMYSAARDNELKSRTHHPTGGPEGVDEAAVIPFVLRLDAEREKVKARGYSLSDVDFMPPDHFTTMRQVAILLVERDPEFLAICNRLWSKEYGPISQEVR